MKLVLTRGTLTAFRKRILCWLGVHPAGPETERRVTHCFVAVETRCAECRRVLSKRYRPVTLRETRHGAQA
jgi:hypothetical protein